MQLKRKRLTSRCRQWIKLRNPLFWRAVIPNQFGTYQRSQGLKMTRMWAASARADERGVWLGDPHRFRNFTDFLVSEQWLDPPVVKLLGQPTRQTLGVPPR